MGAFIGVALSLVAMMVGLAIYESLLVWSGAKERASAFDLLTLRNRAAATSGTASSQRENVGSASATKTFARDVISRLSDTLERFVPLASEDTKTLHEQLRLAGVSITPETWRALRLVLTVAVALLLAFVTFVANTSIVISIVLVAIGAAGGWFGMDLYLNSKRKSRRLRMEVQLPDAMDLLGVALAAGSPVEQCFKEVAGSLDAPLSEEFALVDQEVNLLGISREAALEHLSQRCESQEISAFVAQLLQAINQGSSVIEGLEAQATLARERAQAAALEEIRKMPTKLDVVLSLCFLPPTTILVLVPTVVRLLSFLQTSL